MPPTFCCAPQPPRRAKAPAHKGFLSYRLKELFAKVSVCGGRGLLPPDLADEITATAGELMVELADHRGDRLVRQVIEDARRLREAARTIRPEPARVAESGRALVSDLELDIREDRPRRLN